MAKNPKILPEDYDEWEAEYYAKKSTQSLYGCLFLIAFGIVVIILTLIIQIKTYFL